MATDLVRRQVAVIFANGPAVIAAGAATTTIPIVFQIASDPVQLGLIASMSRPGGNLTGSTSLNVEVATKRLELLHEVAPQAMVLALLVNPTNFNADGLVRDTHAAAASLGLELHVQNATTDREIDAAFTTMMQIKAGGLVISPDPFYGSRNKELAALTARHALPAIHAYREFAEAGGLMSYAGSVAEGFYQAGLYTGRILAGEKPADLPVQQSTKVELTVNLKTAKALGFTVPPSLLARADEVIE
jgi:putative ABC transport system substrate-binding protein